MDEDTGVGGVPGVSQRDQGRSQDVASVGTAQTWKPQAGVFGMRTSGDGDCRGLRAGSTGSAVVGVPHDGGDRAVPGPLSGMRNQGRESSAAAEQGTVQQAF